MNPELDAEGYERFPGAKLNLYSMATLETVLGTSRESLQAIAGLAGSFYRPFPKKDRRRPFQKKFKPPRKRPRIIDNPCGELKSLQRTINEKLLKSVAFPLYLYGGVPGKSISDNIFMHLGAPVLVTVDIKSFFRRITNRQVYGVWRNTLNCSPKIAALLTQITTFERHLPQGAPTSSLLANLVLFSFDQPIRDECARRGVVYSTWVDDLAFSGTNARDLISTVIQTLRSAGFSVSHAKLKIMGPGTRKVLNGVLIDRFPNIVREAIARLRSGIHKLETGQVAASETHKYIQQLTGGITYVASIAPRKAAKLRRDLEAACRDLPNHH